MSLLLLEKNVEITLTRDRGASLTIWKKKIDVVKSKYWARFFLVLLGRTWLNDDKAALDQVKFGGDGGGGGGGGVKVNERKFKREFPPGWKESQFNSLPFGQAVASMYKPEIHFI